MNSPFLSLHKLLAGLLIGFSACSAIADVRLTMPSGDILSNSGKEFQLRLPGQQQSKTLALELPLARTGHSLTVLPSGLVWVHGGADEQGRLIEQDALLNIATGTITSLADSKLLARRGHTATVLMDGKVLIAGGSDAKGKMSGIAEIWDPVSNTTITLAAKPQTRLGGVAQWQADGRILLSGGKNAKGESALSEFFNPLSQTFSTQSDLSVPVSAPKVAFTNPAESSSGVPVQPQIALLFNKHFDSASISVKTVTLWGVDGVIPLKVTAAENGMLAFISPSRALLPGQRYTLFVSGAQDTNQAPLELFSLSFDTALLNGEKNKPESAELAANKLTGLSVNQPAINAAPRSAFNDQDDESWIPNSKNYFGAWRSTRQPASDVLQKRMALFSYRAKAGLLKPAAPESTERMMLRSAGVQMRASSQTSVSGTVLRLNGKPLADVKITVGGVSGKTNEEGRFTLNGVLPGTQEIVVDATQAGGQPGRYGQFVLVEPLADGKANELTHMVWMPKIDQSNMVTISSPTMQEVVLKHPAMPGLEVRIPKGMVIRDREGQIVTRVGLTPMPIDTAPFATPGNFPVYFTVQPGGAFLQQITAGGELGARVIYPNYSGLKSGEKVDVWNYSSARGGWHVYGNATVSGDAKQIVPAQGVVLNDFMGYGFTTETPPVPGPKDPPDGPSCEADPITCHDGAFLHNQTDMAVQDIVPLSVSRSYHSLLAQNQRIYGNKTILPFGLGMSFPYGMRVNVQNNHTLELNLEMPSGAVYSFKSTSTNDNTAAATYIHTVTHGPLRNATIKYVQEGADKDSWLLVLPGGSRYVFMAHGKKGALRYMQDPLGNTVNFIYSGSNLQVISPSGRWINFTYDKNGHIKSASDMLNRTVEYVYESEDLYPGRPELIRLKAVNYPDNTSEQYLYNANLAVAGIEGVINRLGNTMMSNKYEQVTDRAARITQQTLTNGALFEFNYELDGNKVKKTVINKPRKFNGLNDAGNFKRVVTFDAYGRTLTESIADSSDINQTTRFDYEPASGRRYQITDAAGRITRYGYDEQGNTSSITRMFGTAEANTTVLRYDPRGGKDPRFAGLPTAIWNEARPASVTQYAYNDQAQLETITSAQGKQTTLTYTAQGQLQTVTNPLKQTTRYDYRLGDLYSVSDAYGNTTVYETDAQGRVLANRDALGYSTFYEYDSNDYPQKVTDANGLPTSTKYDALGNLRLLTDARNNQFIWDYDFIKDVYTRTDRDNLQDIYRYDTHGNLRSVTDRAKRTTSMTYDALNRALTSVYPDAELAYAYDAQKNTLQMVSEQLPGQALRQYRFTWDNFDRLKSETNAQGVLVYEYDGLSRRNQLTIAALGQPKRALSYEYDDDGRLYSIAENGEAVQYQYNDAGRLAGLNLPKGLSIAYGWYDNGDLKRIEYKSTNNLLGDINYQYDKAGRRTEQSGSWARQLLPTPMEAETDRADRLKKFNGQELEYDLLGNLSKQGGQSYIWDSRNRLVQINNANGPVARFDYDVFGRRIAKTIAGNSTQYLYDGGNAVSELGSNPAQMLAGPGLDNWLARTDSQGRRWMMPDALGSTLALVDDAGNVKTQYSYEAYGETQASGEVSSNPYQYTGRENDGNGMNYYRARYYSPQMKRFISQDPIGVMGGVNLYGYVGGNPVSYVDPNGLAAAGEAIGGAIGGWGAGLIGVESGPGALLAAMIGRKAGKVIGSAIEDFCKGGNDCGPMTRAQAMAAAQAWAQVPRASRTTGANSSVGTGPGRVAIPFDALNPSSRGPNFNQIQAAGGSGLGHENPLNPSGNHVFDHPDGHNDSNAEHHKCPHIHATNPVFGEKIFTYKAGS